jgi:hypothetical protein
MRRVAVLCEGSTEREFLSKELAPGFHDKNLAITPIILVTKRCAEGSNVTGGGVNFDRVCAQLPALLGSFDSVTTFFDLYAFKDRKPGETAAQLQSRIATRLGQPSHFRPYIQQYEFESLVFAVPQAGRIFNSDELSIKMSTILSGYNGNAELINDRVQTTPSARLKALFAELKLGRYDKVAFGTLLLKGNLTAVRQACPQFGGWVTWLESLGT